MNTIHPSWRAVLHDFLKLVPPPKTERVARRDAMNRLLMEDVTADHDYPIGDLSKMDGYAVGVKQSTSYRVAGENRPGHPRGETWREGTARRIFTGAELPAGATRAIPQEMTTRTGDELRVSEFPETSFVRHRGSEAKKGAVILKTGAHLGPVELAILSTVGVSHVQVAVRPRIAHLVTGDEIINPDIPASDPSAIRDSNSDLVSATLHGIGQSICDHQYVQDDANETARVVHAMAAQAELLLISGGASVGDHDHARTALEAAGFRLKAHGFNVRPGKPVGLARRDDQWAVMLPGNPVSHLVALHLFVLPLARALAGETNVEPQLIKGILVMPPATELPRRDTFWPAHATLQDGVFQLTPCRFLSSGDLLGIAGTNALIALPAGKAIPQSGETVYFVSLT